MVVGGAVLDVAVLGPVVDTTDDVVEEDVAVAWLVVGSSTVDVVVVVDSATLSNNGIVVGPSPDVTSLAAPQEAAKIRTPHAARDRNVTRTHRQFDSSREWERLVSVDGRRA